MHNILLIAKREYLERVRTRSFIIMTFLIPALMLGLTILPNMLMMRASGGSRHIVIVASDKKTGDLIQRQLVQTPVAEEKQQEPGKAPAEKNSSFRPQLAKLTVDVDLDTSDAERAALIEKVKNKQVDGVAFATRDALVAKRVPFITQDVSSFIANEQIRGGINQALRHDFLLSKGLNDREIENALQQVDLEAQSPTGGGGNPLTLFFTAFSVAMILYMTVLLYGINVMRAILDEKTSRIMEVMLSIARAKEMMAGKILGVGAVGLTQILIWAIIAAVASSGVLIAGASVIKNILAGRLLVFFPVFFLFGFTLYSSMYAAVGAMVNSEQEAQQLQFVVMMPMILSIVMMSNIIQAPSSALSFWASLFPFTSPLIMLLRIAVQPVPTWQIAVSLGLLAATIYGMVWLCGRIYRVGILMYGKKPTLPEIMKWIKYA